MELTPEKIEGVWLAQSPVWADDRGTFREWFRSSEISAVTGIAFEVKQANISISHQGVVRGIHYSLAPQGQAKWVTCIAGSIIDVIVDIRPNSKTYGQHIAVHLNAGDGRAVLIASGLGHGFISLENNTAISYLLSSPYSPKEEFEINPMDDALGINWVGQLTEGVEVILSPKDANAPTLAEQSKNGNLPL